MLAKGGKIYFMALIDDATRFLYVYFYYKLNMRFYTTSKSTRMELKTY
jgi:hypothetical protein